MSNLVLGVSVSQVSDTDLDSEFPIHLLDKWHLGLQSTFGNLCWLLLLGETSGSRLRARENSVCTDLKVVLKLNNLLSI